MNRKWYEKGFTAVEAAVILVVLVGVAGVGYAMASRHKNQEAARTNQTVTAAAPAAPEISKTSDLNAASSTLDQTDVDAASADTAALDAELNSL